MYLPYFPSKVGFLQFSQGDQKMLLVLTWGLVLIKKNFFSYKIFFFFYNTNVAHKNKDEFDHFIAIRLQEWGEERDYCHTKCCF